MARGPRREAEVGKGAVTVEVAAELDHPAIADLPEVVGSTAEIRHLQPTRPPAPGAARDDEDAIAVELQELVGRDAPVRPGTREVSPPCRHSGQAGPGADFRFQLPR